MKRRDFLRAGGVAATALALPTACFAGEEQKLMKIGIQLYTVRGPMGESVPDTLKGLADIGYDEVEFAGYYDHSPEDIRRMLDDTGLDTPSAHVSLDIMRNHADEAIAAAKVVGHDYLALGWLSPEERNTLDQYRQHAELCSRFGEKCRDAGIQFAWHNHEFEYEAIDGILPMDLLLSETDPDIVKMEIDFYWIAYAGVDPQPYFDAHPGRFPLCHVKDMGADRKMTDVGDGTIDFASLFAASGGAGLTHFFAERDDSPDPMATAAASYAHMKELRF